MSRIAFAIIMTAAWGWSVQAQQSSSGGNTASGTQDSQQTLTPEQQLEEQIRQADPLDQKKDDKDRKRNDKSDRDSRKTSQDNGTPTPGSIASEERDRATADSGPQVVSEDDADRPAQDYAGPAVLSRSYSVNRPLISQELKWSETVGVSFVDNMGAASFLGPSGNAVSSDLLGAMVSWGLSGRHAFKRDQIAVNYHGNYTHYNGVGGFNGGNQGLAIDYTHVMSRRLTLHLVTTGSILSQNYTYGSDVLSPNTTVANISLSSSPNVQIVDYGSKQFNGQADFVWQKSARLSFTGGGSYFLISYDNPNYLTTNGNPGLLGMTGEQARGDMAYRVTRKMTVGTYYSVSHYLFPHGYGVSDTNTFGGIFSYAFSRTLQVRLRGGASVIDARLLQSVSIPPAIAVLLGQSSGLIDVYNLTTTSDVSAQLIKDFRRGKTANVAFAHGVSPGNGYLLTSVQESMSAGFGMPLFRRYMIQATVGRDALSAVAQTLGNYRAEYGTISVSRQLQQQGVTASFSATIRHYDLSQFIGLQNQILLSAGVNWGSQNGRLWPF